jgi:hypothetical protein
MDVHRLRQRVGSDGGGPQHRITAVMRAASLPSGVRSVSAVHHPFGVASGSLRVAARLCRLATSWFARAMAAWRQAAKAIDS